MNTTRICIAVFSAAILTTIKATSLISPSGGEVALGYRPNSNVTVKWDNALGAMYVDVGIWDGDRGQLHIVSQRIAASVGTSNITIPATLLEGTHYRFVVRDSDHQQRAEFSSGFLRIQLPQPTVSSVSVIGESTMIQCSPQPASDRVEFTWDDIQVLRIELYDVADRLIIVQNVQESDHTSVLNISGCATGMYSARVITSDGNVFAKKVLVSR